MEREGLDTWLEIVIRIHERRYKSRQREGESFTRFPRRVRYILHDSPWHGYDLTFASYLFELEDDNLVFGEIPISVPSWERMDRK
jgi:hypothetical protein